MKLNSLAAASLVLLGASSVAAEEVSLDLDFVFVHMICSFYDGICVGLYILYTRLILHSQSYLLQYVINLA